MGFFNWFGRNREQEQRTLTHDSFFGSTSAEIISLTGDEEDVNPYDCINERNALASSAFFGCVNLISRQFATLSFGVYQKTDKGRQALNDHRVYKLFKNPSPLYSGWSYRQASQAQYSTYGDTVSYIENPYTNPQLILQCARSVRLDIVKGEPIYVINGKPYSADQVLHIHGFSFDGAGRCLHTPLAAAKRILGLTLAAEDFGRAFFANDGVSGEIWQTAKTLRPEKRLEFEMALNKNHKGAKKSHKRTIVEGDWTITRNQIDGDKTQLQETREFNDRAIASQIFSMPPTMIGYGEVKSVEEEGIYFAQATMLPILKSWEDEINRKLFTLQEQSDGCYLEFNIDSLNRANLATRYNSYSIGRQIGLYSINQLAEKENLPSIENGDDHMQPLNWGSVMNPQQPPAQNTPKNNPNTIEKMGEEITAEKRNQEADLERFRPLIDDAAKRCLHKEGKAILRAAEKFGNDAKGFNVWFEDFCKTNRSYVVEVFSPVAQAMWGERAAQALDSYSDRHVTASRQDVALALMSKNPDVIEEMISSWDERSKSVANIFIQLENHAT